VNEELELPHREGPALSQAKELSLKDGKLLLGEELEDAL
jgi:hypothetical protein